MTHWILGTYGLDAAQCHQAVSQTMPNHVDTAALYRNEAAVHQALCTLGRRDDTRVTTKLHWRDICQGRDGILAAAEQSIERLGGHVDVLLLHCPTDNAAQAWDVLRNDVLGRDKVDAIGVSNFGIRDLAALETSPTFNQIELSPFLPRTQLCEYCHENNIAVTAHSTLARGQLLHNYEALDRARRYNATPAQVCAAWTRQARQATPIVRTTNWEHARQLGVDVPLHNKDLQPWTTAPICLFPRFAYLN